MKENKWEEIAEQYRKEIELLHRDIEKAIEEFEKRIPRSFEKGIVILDHALLDSQNNLFFIKLMESPIICKKSVSYEKITVEDNDCFEGLL